MDTIFIKDLILEGVHGLMSHEKDKPQRFRINLEIKTPEKIYKDKIGETFDYSKAKKIIRDTISGPHTGLVEVIAQNICQRILIEDENVNEVKITIEKLDIWKDGIPGVTIIRKR